MGRIDLVEAAERQPPDLSSEVEVEMSTWCHRPYAGRPISWAHGSFDGTELPWAITRDAVEYYLRRIGDMANGDAGGYEFSQAELVYTASVEPAVQGHLVTLQLSWSQTCGPDCGMHFAQARRVYFDAGGTVLRVEGDGCSDELVLV